jgi:hypothetical protein
LNAALCRVRVVFIVLLLLPREAGAVYTTLAAGPNFGILFTQLTAGHTPGAQLNLCQTANG